MPDARRTIHVLDPAVARKIAAGEVIERPAGVVRELLDNALDAGASQIDVDLVGGGSELVAVVDDGHGMARDDLERCVLPHATSKIASEDDLLRVQTLGFRGEALSSIAAVSRLAIASAPADADGHELRVEAGRVVHLGRAAVRPGTSVRVADLFYNVPARKHFQKRASSELAVSRGVVLDKALAFPEVGFRLTSAGEPHRLLPPGSRIERIVAAYPQRTEPSLLHEVSASGEGFRATVVASEPSAHRGDRKGLQVFVNRRRVWEYALQQAIEYAYRDYLHGGLYPVAYLFLEVDPELVDFNIHPAKREVRFRTLPEIHRRIVAAMTGFLRIFDRRAVATGESLPFFDSDPAPGERPLRHATHEPGGHQPGGHGPDGHAPGGDAPRSHDGVLASPATGTSHTQTSGGEPRPAVAPWPPERGKAPSTAFDLTRRLDLSRDGEGFRYLGQLMDLFLVVERGDRLYLVDQHAAHERIIYDRLRRGGRGQELLFPVRLEVDRQSEPALRAQRRALEELGIALEERDGGWELVSVPAMVAIEAESLAALLMELLDRPADFQRELYASLSCRSAVMDGDRLADETAMEIIRGVLGLENARCPHGRPIWVSWSRDELASLVGRTG